MSRRKYPYTRASKVHIIDAETGEKIGSQRAYTPPEFREIVGTGTKRARPPQRARKRRNHHN